MDASVVEKSTRSARWTMIGWTLLAVGAVLVLVLGAWAPAAIDRLMTRMLAGLFGFIRKNQQAILVTAGGVVACIWLFLAIRCRQEDQV